MADRRPFSGLVELHSTAEQEWNRLSQQDWLEALAKHPKIGDGSGGEWSRQEQRGIDSAASDVAGSIRRLNIDYERKFGWIFIICATGKSANEMLAALTSRIENGSERELEIAADEQAKIMHLRLDKLLSE
jgi:2-oxo-4-hydroxy-4-carboxy-5-ureidoimidazoline decarboxylase